MRDSFLTLLGQHPLVVSAQASPGAPVDRPETLRQLAECSLLNGCRILRLQGAETIQHVKARHLVPIIGLIKRDYANSEIFITPGLREVEELLETGCEVIALDATDRPRPGGSTLQELVQRIHTGGRLAMADCDCEATVHHAISAGCDLIGTTLAGYTPARPMTAGPDFELLRFAVSTGRPVIAEGRYALRWQIEAALSIGAIAVVVGGAINDPVKQTRALLPRPKMGARVGAVDIGGTWIRFATFDGKQLGNRVSEKLPPTRAERREWIQAQVHASGISRLGVSTGGTVDPNSGKVWEAKPIIPDHLGTVFSQSEFGVEIAALNDGLATAWGHAQHPRFAGKRVLTLALGTGVGAGFVSEGQIRCGDRGEYPRLNDLMAAGGRTVEDLLGGASLTPHPSDEQKRDAIQAFDLALKTARELLYPDVVVVGGGVGLADWMRPVIDARGCEVSPYGSDAGLIGAAWLAIRG